jgi:hypothetical protein
MVIAWIAGGIRAWEGDRAPLLRSGHTRVRRAPGGCLTGQPICCSIHRLTTVRTPRQPRPAAAVADRCRWPAGPDDLFRGLRARAEGGDTVLTGVLADQAAR